MPTVSSFLSLLLYARPEPGPGAPSTLADVEAMQQAVARDASQQPEYPVVASGRTEGSDMTDAEWAALTHTGPGYDGWPDTPAYSFLPPVATDTSSTVVRVTLPATASCALCGAPVAITGVPRGLICHLLVEVHHCDPEAVVEALFEPTVASVRSNPTVMDIVDATRRASED